MKKQLILLHGALGAAAQLEPLKEELSERFNIYLFNFEGHGGRISDNPYSIDLFSDNLKKFIEDNKLKGASVFGYSMGGYVALKLATKEPKLISGIVTLGTKFAWDPEAAAREVKMLDPEKILEKIPKYAAFLEQLHAPLDWKEVLLKTGEMMLDLGNGAGLTDSELKTIEIPVQIGVGDQDQMVSIPESERIARLIPGASFKVYQNFIHPIDRIDLEILVNSISEFLND